MQRLTTMDKPKTNNGLVLYRTKRVPQELKDACHDFALASKITGGISNVAGALGNLLGPVGKGIAALVQIGTTVISTGTDVATLELGCSDIPFEEIKELMYKMFWEQDKNLERNYQLLGAVANIATKTLLNVEAIRTEMHEGFGIIASMIQESKIGPIAAKMNDFIQYFDEHKSSINKLTKEEYFESNETVNNVLENLGLLRTPTGGSLTAMNEIIDRNLAKPKDFTSVYEFKALDALYYGAQTYFSVLFFLIEQHSTIASYYYEIGDLDKYNDHFVKIDATFKDLMKAVSSTTSLVNKVVNAIEQAARNELISDEQRKDLLKKIKELKGKKKEITGRDSPYITANPKILPQNPIVNENNCGIAIRDQEYDTKISYAIQYKSGDKYSKIGEWSAEITIKDTTIPTLRIPVDRKGWTRIIFRKFLDEHNRNPEMVGIIEDASQYNFQDINRDLYNAALKNNFKRFEELLNNGADPKVAFDQGRTAVHAAAKAGNKEIIKKVMSIDKNEINRRDSKGYTPLHVASEAGHDDFLKVLIEEHGAGINARTDYHKVTPLHLAVKEGYLHTVKALLKFDKIDVNLGDMNGLTPLHYAISNSAEIVKALLKHENINVNARSEVNITPLHLAAINSLSETAKELLKDNRTVVDIKSDGKLTALHYAVSAGSVEIVKLLKEHKANVDAQDENYLTPLHISLRLPKNDVALELLNGPIDVDIRDKKNVTPLHIAVTTGKKDIVQKLLKKGADVNVTTAEGLTPLHIAAMRKRKQIVIVLADSHAQIEARTNNGTTPLLAACQKEAVGIVKYLVDERGADIMAKDNSGNDILQMSIKNDDLDMVKYIINNKRFTQDLSSVLKLALPYGRLSVVEYLVEEKNVDASCTDRNNYCPLSEACKYNFLPVVEYLVKKVRNVPLSGKPFQNALQYGQLEIVKYFIEKKDVPDDIKDEYLQTPLQIATKYGWYDIVKYLVEVRHKSIANTKLDYGRTLLHLAAGSGNLDLIKYLIDEGNVDPHITDVYGDNVLHYAITGINVYNLDEKKVVGNLKYLIVKEKVDFNVSSTYDKTPLEQAMIYDFIHVVELLASLGAEIPLESQYGMVSNKMRNFLDIQRICNDIIQKQETTNDKAKMYAHKRFTIGLDASEKCIDKRKPNVYHSTALHLSISIGSTELAYKILEWNADVNSKDEQGNTPLHLAVMKGNVDLIKRLMKYGADVTIKNVKDQTPIRLAKINNQEEILEVLKLEQLKLKLWSAANGNGITNLNQFDKLKGDLCEEDKNGNTLMHLSASKGHIDIVNYLIRKKCAIDVMNREGKTPLYLATSNGHIDIIQVLLDSGVDITTTRNSSENVVTYKYNSNTTKLSINKGPFYEKSLVCRMVKYQDFDIVRLFVDQRNSNDYFLTDDSNMQYHLFNSVKEGSPGSIQFLIDEYNVDVNYLYRGLPPLADACIAGHFNVVEYLIKQGSDSGKKGMFGCTPLHWAVFSGHLDIVEYLAQRNQSNLKVVDAGGRTPLHYSVMYAKSNTVKYFVDTQRLDVNVKDNNANTVVHLATQWNNEDTLTYLINEKGVSLKSKNKQGSTPLHIAAANGNLKIVELLIKKGANVEETDNKGRTPLFIATENGYMELITYFLDNGARLDTRDKDGLALNDIAGKMGHLEIESFISEQLKPSNDSKFLSNYLTENCRYMRFGGPPLILNKRSADNQTSVNLRGTACLQNNLSLGLLVLQNYFDKNFPLPKFTQITPEIARATSLEIIDDLEKLIQKSTPSGDEVLDKLDFYQLYLDIGANIKNETFSEIPKILLKFINSGCWDDSQVLNKIIGEIGDMFPKRKNQ